MVWGFNVRRSSRSIVEDKGEGLRAYIRIDNDLEQTMRCEADGVTEGGVSNDL